MINSPTTEALVLSALMKNPKLLLSFDHLKMSLFTTKCNKFIFTMIFELYKNNTNYIEPADIWGRAEIYQGGTEKLQSGGGLQYLKTMFDTTEEIVTEEMIRGQVETLIECSCKRELQKFFTKYSTELEDNSDISLDTVFSTMEGKKNEVLNKYTSINKPKLIGDVIDVEWERLEQLRAEGFTGYTSCIPMLNEFFTYKPTELIVGHAKAKVGKSFFVLNECKHLAIDQGIPVAVLDSELSDLTFITRMIARLSGFTIKMIENGTYLEQSDGEQRVERAKNILRDAPIHHCFMPDSWTDTAVCTKIKQLVLQFGVKMAIIDYIKSPSVGVNEKESDILGNFTQKVKDTIGVLNIPCLAFVQSSPYPTESGMLRIADSRKVERYASTIFYLDKKTSELRGQEFNEQGGNTKLVVTHNRNGAQAPEDDPTCGINIDVNWKIAKMEQARWQCDVIKKLLEDNE